MEVATQRLQRFTPFDPVSGLGTSLYARSDGTHSSNPQAPWSRTHAVRKSELGLVLSEYENNCVVASANAVSGPH